MNIIDDWKNSLCLEDDIPVIDNLITLQSIYNYCLEGENMINREATIRWKGYDPDDLKPHSHKKVWTNCENCGAGRWVRLLDYRDLCKSCSILGRRHTEESRKKMSEIAKLNRPDMHGKNNPMYGKHHSNETKRLIGMTQKGKFVSDETRKKLSKSGKGKKHTAETKKKISDSHIGLHAGEKNPNYGNAREKNPNWKGGHKLSKARSSAKRKELFDFIPLNKPHDGLDGHHLDFDYVLFIPKELHQRIRHSVSQNLNMEQINDVACDWYLEFQGVSS